MQFDHARRFVGLCALGLVTGAVQAQDDAATLDIDGSEGTALTGTVLETFEGPWAMTFLPDGRALVTEKGGTLWLLDANGAKAGEIANAPEVVAQGQGGLGDVIVHPDFADNGVVYLSYAERDEANGSLSGAAVERATLALSDEGGELRERTVIWRQSPKVTGSGHYGHRLALSPDGFLFITSGERQKFSPAQNMDMNLGKVVRLEQDGAVPEDNPFVGSGGVADQVWTLGHRNPLGIDFDADGQLWVHEMGPKGGDELNRIVRSENYGYPEVSEGSHYSGEPIPSHQDDLAFENPALSWSPVISPAGFAIYDGELFGEWSGNGLIGGLSSQALIRVAFEQAPVDNTGAPADSVEESETVASEVERYSWGKRIREVEEGADGSVYVLEDGSGGRLIRLEPAG